MLPSWVRWRPGWWQRLGFLGVVGRPSEHADTVRPPRQPAHGSARWWPRPPWQAVGSGCSYPAAVPAHPRQHLGRPRSHGRSCAMVGVGRAQALWICVLQAGDGPECHSSAPAWQEEVGVGPGAAEAPPLSQVQAQAQARAGARGPVRCCAPPC